MVSPGRLSALVVCLAGAQLALGAADSVARWRDSLIQGNESRRQGKYAEARRSYLDALAEAEKFGPDDPRLAATLNNLGALLFDYGDYAEAERILRRAVGILERTAPDGNGDTANALNNLATLLAKAGR